MPRGLRLGIYDVVARNSDGRTARLERAYTIIDSTLNPDLSLEDGIELTPSFGWNATQPFTLELRATQVGGQTGAQNIPVDLKLNGQAFRRVTIPQLDPDSEVIVRFNAQLQAGRYEVSAIINPDNTFAESEQANNTVSTILNVAEQPPEVASEEWQLVQPPSLDDEGDVTLLLRAEQLITGAQLAAALASRTPPTASGTQASSNASGDTTRGATTSGRRRPPSKPLIMVSSSGDEAELKFRLDQTPGVHFFLVRSIDEEGNLGPVTVTEVNYLPTRDGTQDDDDDPLAQAAPGIPGTIPLAAGESHNFVFTLNEEDLLNVILVSGTDDADIYVWALDTGELVEVSNETSGIDEIAMDAPRDGKYLVEIYAESDTTYDLDVTIDSATGAATTSMRSATIAGGRATSLAGAAPANTKPERLEPVLDLEVYDELYSILPDLSVIQKVIYLPVVVK